MQAKSEGLSFAVWSMSKMQLWGTSPSSSESLCIYSQPAVLAWERRYCKRAMVESFKNKDLSLIFLLLLLYVVGRTHQGSGMKGENNSSQDSYPVTEGQDQGRLFSCRADSLDPAKSTPLSTSSILYRMFHLGWSESVIFNGMKKGKKGGKVGGSRGVYVFMIFNKYLLGGRPYGVTLYTLYFLSLQ